MLDIMYIMPNKAGGSSPRNDDFGSSYRNLQLLPFEGMYVIVKNSICEEP